MINSQNLIYTNILDLTWLKTNSKLVLMSPTCRLVVMLMSCSYFPGKVIIKVDLD